MTLWTAASVGQRSDLLNMFFRVHSRHIEIVCSLHGNTSDPCEQTRCLHLCMDGFQSSRAFRMPSGVVQQKSVIHVQQRHVVTSRGSCGSWFSVPAAMRETMAQATADASTTHMISIHSIVENPQLTSTPSIRICTSQQVALSS